MHFASRKNIYKGVGLRPAKPAGISKHLVELGGHRRADDAGDCAECGQHAWSKAARKHGRYPEKTIPVKHVTHSGQDAQDTDAKHHGWHALTICCHRCCGGHHHCWHCGTCCDFKRGGSTKLCGWSRATDEGNAAEGNASGQGDASSDQLGGAGHDRKSCCLVHTKFFSTLSFESGMNRSFT